MNFMVGDELVICVLTIYLFAARGCVMLKFAAGIIMGTTYKLLGGDGKEYGPVTLEQLQSWLKEGRVTAATQILRSDLNVWHPASDYGELGLGEAPAPAPSTESGVNRPDQGGHPAESVEFERRIRSGGSWFYWIAGLSLANTIVSASGGGVGFVIGLTITQVIDHFVRGAEGGAKAVALVLNVGVAGV